VSDFSYLKGIYNITPTPFKADGSLDETSLARLTEFTLKTGVDGMTILGVLGEAGKVSDAERERIIGVVLEAAGGRFPICVGTSHAGTDQCVAYSKQAEQMGAKAVMVAPPRLSRSNDAALRRHYLAVAEAIDIPIVVQDHPASSGVFMSVEFVAAIAEEAPQCRFLKLEDEPSPPKVSRVKAANPNVIIFGGLGGMMFLEELRHGAHGTMTGFAFPEILVAIYQMYSRGDIDGATETFYRYCPLIRFENQPLINLALRKHIYFKRGAIASPRVRAPFMPVDEDTLADLEDLWTRLNLSSFDSH
jgi:4-hydroxy-tetrahydrodipicolinate synthase